MDSARWIRTDTILLVAGLLLIGYLIGEVLLLVFAAVVLAIGPDGAARAIAQQLTFIPFIGPLIATIPIVAAGFAAGTQTGLIVLIGYIVIQSIEGNLLVPLIQQRAVDLARALRIGVQVLFSLIFGVVGLILAAPLTIVAIVAVQMLWVEHTLGEKLT